MVGSKVMTKSTTSIISMCFDVTDFLKHNVNARRDLVALCNRPSLEPKINAKEKLKNHGLHTV
jgi:hypothetical protein